MRSSGGLSKKDLRLDLAGEIRLSFADGIFPLTPSAGLNVMTLQMHTFVMRMVLSWMGTLLLRSPSSSIGLTLLPGL
jgi:hypothetical protein